MRVAVGRPLPVWHTHVGSEGPKGRKHFHSLRVEIAVDVPFNPKTGVAVDADQLAERAELVLSSLNGAFLDELPGLIPSLQALALLVRERLLADYPNVQVKLDVPEEEICIWT